MIIKGIGEKELLHLNEMPLEKGESPLSYSIPVSSYKPIPMGYRTPESWTEMKSKLHRLSPPSWKGV